ncbi:MAG TPA: succinic semialdehyde dehydrogenase [Actinophytocola sp.]|uniref:succinic semialdehyde dehydrogenase n=1 Tax=Actinophytocola sp. TaxID=1872138 RepID=UPI002DB7A6B9|nr:succinic semialdehyde dehydrogenase [Actinophytocola sp.]HEU5475394.1 succinic semialdehyde dehydrogenase [Actinophytocola sp.]
MRPVPTEQLRHYVVASTSDTVTPVEVYTGAELATLPRSGPADVLTAVERGRRAQTAWAATDLADRKAIFARFHGLLLAHREELADLVQAETGKARRDAFEEIAEPVLVTSYYLRRAGALLRPRRRAGAMPLAVRATELRVPHGVVGVIAPWNYPLALSMADAIPALFAGNAVVLKPDSQTALSPLLAVDLMHRAGLPEHLIQVVLGDGPVIGAAVVDSTDFVAFTGSTRTGIEVAARAAERLIGCSLELGGKNPMIVLDDAPLDRAAAIAARGAFANAGQLCLSMERIYVPEPTFDAFAKRLVAVTENLRLGAGYDYGFDVGSLVSAAQLKRVSEHVDDARAKGARVLSGGRPRPDLGPYFYEPTVLAEVNPDMLCHTEETFGPVVSLYPYRTLDEAVLLANQSAFGLNASVLGDARRAAAVAPRLRAGTVNVNDAVNSAYGSTDAPMGGMRASGLGRRHGAEGLLKYTEAQTVAVQRIPVLGVPRWLPFRVYARVLVGALKALRRLRIR